MKAVDSRGGELAASGTEISAYQKTRFLLLPFEEGEELTSAEEGPTPYQVEEGSTPHIEEEDVEGGVPIEEEATTLKMSKRFLRDRL